MRITAIGFLALWLTACGAGHVFRGGISTHNKTDEKSPSRKGADARISDGALSLAFSCDDQGSADGGLPGVGEHNVDLETDFIDLSFSGELCRTETLAREIIFAIDVSGTMLNLTSSGNDPYEGNSCGRFRAIEGVLNRLPTDGRVTVGVTTFDSAVANQLMKKFEGKQAWLRALGLSDSVPSTDAAGVVCQGSGATNYDSALRGAKLQFNFDKQAARQLIFVSDGLPNPVTADGSDYAQKLKDLGVMIGTVMLKGDDSIMREVIASRDAEGNPLHVKVENADELADAVADVEANPLRSALVKYRALGSEKEWAVQNVFSDEGSTFASGAIGLERSEFPDGVEYILILGYQSGDLIEKAGSVSW